MASTNKKYSVGKCETINLTKISMPGLLTLRLRSNK